VLSPLRHPCTSFTFLEQLGQSAPFGIQSVNQARTKIYDASGSQKFEGELFVILAESRKTPEGSLMN